MPSSVPASCEAKRDAAQPAQRLAAEDARGDAAPGAAHAVQRPDAKHVVDPPAVLRLREQEDEQPAGDRAGRERAQRMHDVRSRADGDESGERPVVHEPGIVPADDEGGDRAAGHREQRVDGDEPRDLVDGLRAHHVEPEPADGEDPGAEREEGDRRRRMRRDAALLRVAAAARTEHQHGDEPDPAADRVHDDAPGEVVELLAERALEPRLNAEVLVPGDALEERVDEAHQQERRRELRVEPRALGDAAGDDRGDRRGEGEQEEELDELVAALLGERLRAGEEIDAVGDRVADEEVRDGRHREVDEDLAPAR